MLKKKTWHTARMKRSVLTQYSSAKRGPFWFLDRLNLPTDQNEQEVADVYVLDTGIDFEHSEFGNRAKYAGYDPF